jgi:phosphatidylglycerophosphatase A
LTTSPELSLPPTWRFVFKNPAHCLAFGFGAGLSPVAPGTAGTLVALPLYAVVAPALSSALGFAVLGALFVLGIWATGVTGKALGVADHGGMVWDEIVAFLLVLYCIPGTLFWTAAGFVLFRLFDIVKPFPIGWLDRSLKGGVGVMLDDLLAAAYTIASVELLQRIFNV